MSAADREAAHEWAKCIGFATSAEDRDKNLAAAYLEVETELAAERTARAQETAAYMDLLGKSQEPVAWMVKCGQGTAAFADEYWQVEFYTKERKDCVVTALYTAPQDAREARAKALEEAAKVCDKLLNDLSASSGVFTEKELRPSALSAVQLAAAIRALK